MAEKSDPPADLPHNPDKAFFACTAFDRDFYESAPVRFQFVRELPLSPDRLFDVFEDPKSWPKWARPGITKVEWTSPKPYGPGTTRTVFFPGGIEVYEDFFIFDRGKEMAFRFYGTTEEIWERFGEHYRVEDLGDGRSRLTWTVAYEPAGGFAKAHPWVKPVMRLSLGSYMWQLARYCRRLS